MNKLFPIVLALFCFGFLLSIEAITDYHPNGAPKVIKTYSGSNKLELTKEIGYYSNGVKQYQTTYYKGEVKDTQRWDESGKKIKGRNNSSFFLKVKFDDDVLGLSQGNDVIYSGLLIGEVKTVGKTGGITPIITLSIKKEYEDILYKDAIFTVKSPLSVGDYWVEVTRGIFKSNDKIVEGEVLVGRTEIKKENRFEVDSYPFKQNILLGKWKYSGVISTQGYGYGMSQENHRFYEDKDGKLRFELYYETDGGYKESSGEFEFYDWVPLDSLSNYQKSFCDKCESHNVSRIVLDSDWGPNGSDWLIIFTDENQFLFINDDNIEYIIYNRKNSSK